jgi:cysteine-rich repeat protein
VCGNSVQEAGEGCDDGNMAAGDGCDASCASETQAPLTCAEAQAAGDRCTICACTRCGGEGRACTVRGSPARSAGCRALAACIRVNDCSTIDCYCGSDLAGCVSGMPTGPCRAEVEATVGSDNILQIVQQLQNERSPLYRAVQQSVCEIRQCGAVCGD